MKPVHAFTRYARWNKTKYIKYAMILSALLLLMVLLKSGGKERLLSDGICAIPVATQSGLVKGISDRETHTCSWRGIPYAAPPVDLLRWRPPQSPPTWTGVRAASKWGGSCMQPDNLLLRFMVADPSDEMGEDCLFLNIWRPKKEGTFPVVVIIPGGGFGMGTGNMPGYWGDRLAEHGDVVVVTFNYRLGMLGFLALPELRDEDHRRGTGNYGLLDQVAALTWIRQNIKNFGGKPDNVTLLGQSAGGWSVCTLLASSKAEGLFHRAVMESGGCRHVETLDTGFQQGDKFARQLGCEPHDLACLRAVPADEIRDQTPLPSWTGFAYGPHIDGDLLTVAPIAHIRNGPVNRMPWIVGNNRDELVLQLLGAANHLSDTPASEYERVLADIFKIPPEQAGALAQRYPLVRFHNRPIKAFQRMATDIAFACPSRDSATTAAAAGLPTYYYRFDYTDFRLGSVIGATHGIEIPFVLDSFDRRSFGLFFNDDMAKRGQPLSKIMQAYWLNFAKTGDPNAADLPQWPRFDPTNPKVHILDKNIRDEPLRQANTCAFWRDRNLNMGW